FKIGINVHTPDRYPVTIIKPDSPQRGIDDRYAAQQKIRAIVYDEHECVHGLPAAIIPAHIHTCRLRDFNLTDDFDIHVAHFGKIILSQAVKGTPSGHGYVRGILRVDHATAALEEVLAVLTQK